MRMPRFSNPQMESRCSVISDVSMDEVLPAADAHAANEERRAKQPPDRRPTLPTGFTNPWHVQWVKTPYGFGHVEHFDIRRNLYTIKTTFGATLSITSEKVQILHEPPEQYNVQLQQPATQEPRKSKRGRDDLGEQLESRKNLNQLAP